MGRGAPLPLEGDLPFGVTPIVSHDAGREICIDASRLSLATEGKESSLFLWVYGYAT